MVKFLSFLFLVCFAQAETGVVSATGQHHTQVAPKKGTPKQQSATSHNTCSTGCPQEIALRNKILDVKYQTKEEKRKAQDVLHNRTSNPSTPPTHKTAKDGVGSCQSSCHNLDVQNIILSKEEAELEKAKQQHRDAIEQMKIKAQHTPQSPAAQHATPSHSQAQKAETCPKNCHEAVQALQQAYHLRQEIEQAKQAQNPHYTAKTLTPPTVQDSGQHCQADCAQVKGIQRQIQKYEAELAKVKATPAHPTQHPQTPQSTALVVHNPQSKQVDLSHVQAPKLSSADITAMTHPKEICLNVGQMLKMIYSVEQKIHTLNPRYTPHIKSPIDLAQFRQGSCSAESPTVMELRTVHGTLKAYLSDLESASHGQASHALEHTQHQALPAPHPQQAQAQSTALIPHKPAELEKVKADHSQAQAQSTALIPHKPVAAGTCPKNCHEAWYHLQEAYKLRQEIEQAKHAHNPHYEMKQIKAPTMQDSGQSCHADCPQVKGIQREVEKYKAELEKVKADHSQAQSTALIPHKPVAAGTCPKNCHEAWYYLHEIHNVRQQIEQTKHAKDSTYQMQTLKAPTMQDSGQSCHADCPQVLGIQRQLKKYQDELAAITAGNALPAPQKGLKGQCKQGCDNETALRIEVQDLNKQLDQLKHKADPNYRVKTYKPITAAKTGVTCPVGCNNIKQLEKRKAQLTQAIAQMKSGHAQPIVTEPDDEHALVPYTGGGHTNDDDYSGPTIEDITDQPQKKKPGFLSHVKSKIKSGASTVRNKFRGKPSSSNANNQLVPYDDDDTSGALVPYDGDDDDTSGALVPYDNDDQDQFDDDAFDKQLQTKRPSRGGYDPYGTDDDLNYNQGYGYNQNTGNYNPYGNQMVPYGQSYGYNPYGGSSTTHEESGPMYPYPAMGGEIFHSDTDNQGANAGASAMAAFGSVLAGLLQQPAAPAATAPAPAVQPAPQPVTPQSVAPQDDSDLDDLYGGGGDYAPTTGSGSSTYGSSSSSFGSGSYSSPSSSSYGSSSYGSGGSSYRSSSSYGSSSSSSGYNSYNDWD
ncbi:MAG: hypothetical protein KF798_02070 [Candidatus Paracaedibacteraceae bacterium]|nr:hypothetical protein [Candidatus Paracaedibacteraceae bacterium]